MSRQVNTISQPSEPHPSDNAMANADVNVVNIIEEIQTACANSNNIVATKYDINAETILLLKNNSENVTKTLEKTMVFINELYSAFVYTCRQNTEEIN